MKRLLALLLAAMLALTLVACGGEEENTGAPSASAPSSENLDTPSDAPGSAEISPAPEDEAVIAGEYVNVGIYPGDAYVLDENGGFNRIASQGEETGTYTVDDKGKIVLQLEGGGLRPLTAHDGYYHTNDKMTQYGMPPSFDENGHSDQTFTLEVSGVTMTLELRADGSYAFSYSKGSPVHPVYELMDVVTYEGSYALEGDVLNLSWKDSTFRLLCTDDAIYPIVYERKTDENRADLEGVQAAVQAAEEDAAQNRWWTPADEAVAAEITEALAGTWEYSDDYSLYQLSFEDEETWIHMEFMGTSTLNSSASYTVLNGAILLTYETRSGGYEITEYMAAPYTYTDGVLTLYEMRDLMNDKALLEPAVDFAAISEYQYEKVS